MENLIVSSRHGGLAVDDLAESRRRRIELAFFAASADNAARTPY